MNGPETNHICKICKCPMLPDWIKTNTDEQNLGYRLIVEHFLACFSKARWWIKNQGSRGNLLHSVGIPFQITLILRCRILHLTQNEFGILLSNKISLCYTNFSTKEYNKIFFYDIVYLGFKPFFLLTFQFIDYLTCTCGWHSLWDA